jgi:hypothetical protein
VAPGPTGGQASLEVPVRDGSLEFIVHGVRRTNVAQSPTNPVAQTQAAGEYIIVDLTVKNVGSAPVQYFTDSQSLVIDGKQHRADILAAVYLSPQSADFIQPGLAIDVATPFDVPVGSVPQSILLNDITEPSVVTVSLVGPTTSTSASPDPAVPTVTGSHASVVVLVDCGDDGVANVNVEYGTAPPQTVLVGKNPTTLGAGGLATFSSNYGTAPGYGDANLTVTTSPTRGTCKTTLTNYDTGNVIAERETAG